MLQKTIIFGLILVCCFSSRCKRYEEDSSITLQTVKSRIAGKWQLEQFLMNNNDSTNAYKNLLPTLVLTITKDGKYSKYCNCYARDKMGKKIPFVTDEKGTWTLTENKQYFSIIPGLFNSTVKSYKIVKLSKKQFWYTEEKGSDLLEYHFQK